MKRVILFAQGYFGELVYNALKDNNIFAPLYTYAASATRRKSDREHLREGYPYRYINERSYDSALIPLSPDDIVLCADWSKDFFLAAPPACPVYYLHPSLLPMYRGYGAVSEQFLKGTALGGATLYLANERIDGGPVVYQQKLPISFTDYPQDYLGKCAKYAGLWGGALAAGEEPEPVPQNEEAAFYVQRKRRNQALIDLNAMAIYIYNIVRAYSRPYFGAKLIYKGKEITVWRAACEKWTGDYGPPGALISQGAYGTELAAGDGTIILNEIEYAADIYRDDGVSELLASF